MTEERLLMLLKTIGENVPAEEYPEIYMVIEDVADDDFTCAYEDAVSYADSFLDADRSKPMPEPVAAFVKEVYGEEIASGSAAAACNLGSVYYTGRIGVQDFAMAVELYSLAAQRGDRQAAENLGYCYYYGRNIPVDYEKAFHCFALGAFDGHIVSLYKIGDMYRNGYYVEKNEKEAFYIYQRCIATMTEEAKKLCGADVYLRMADCYAEGIGTEPDVSNALALYQVAGNLFRERIMDGDFYLKGNYRKCVRKENELREILEQDFPEWSGF